MPAPRKTRPLLLEDGSTFRIGPRTVSVDVSDLPMDQPAVWLHINPNAAAVELPPRLDGTPQLPAHVRPDVVVAMVEQINTVVAMYPEDGRPPPLVVPAIIKRLAKHTKHWPTPAWWRIGNQTGFPGKHPTTGTPQALYVHRDTGACELWTGDATAPDPVRSAGTWEDIPRRDAREWLTANGYTSIPAVLLAPPRKPPRVVDDTPPASG